jgi:hypothetical protein
MLDFCGEHNVNAEIEMIDGSRSMPLTIVS